MTGFKNKQIRSKLTFKCPESHLATWPGYLKPDEYDLKNNNEYKTCPSCSKGMKLVAASPYVVSSI